MFPFQIFYPPGTRIFACGLRMPRRPNRVAAPPLPPSASKSTAAVHGDGGGHPSVGIWWNSPFTSSRGASVTSAVRIGECSGQAAAVQFPSPTPELQNWGKDPHPPGGFLSFLQNPSSIQTPQQMATPPNMTHNSSFLSCPPHYIPFPTAEALPTNGIPSTPLAKLSTPLTPSGSQSQTFINVDSADEEGEIRSEKRLAWTKEEDLRLMSSWLNNSNDPIKGNNKKNEQYWSDVTTVYNNTTPKNRRRVAKQAKDHWHCLNKLVFQFQCCWNKASNIYASGQSDDQLMDKAHAFYESDFKGQFQHMNCWQAVRDQPKWHTYNEFLDKMKKRKKGEAGEAVDDVSSHKDMEDIPRPIGTKAAKAERNGKGKATAATVDIELLDKYLAAQSKAEENRSGVLELQQRLSAEKLETAKLSAQVAKENRQSKKTEKESEMLRTYRALIMQDIVGMTEEMKAEHVMALKTIRERLFGDTK